MGMRVAETQEIASSRLAVAGMSTALASLLRLAQFACKNNIRTVYMIMGADREMCISIFCNGRRLIAD